MDDFLTELIKIGAVLVPVLTAFAWLNSRLSAVTKIIYSQSEKILSKLEYHERHDDDRFESVRKDLWQIRVQNAARTGKVNGDSHSSH